MRSTIREDIEPRYSSPEISGESRILDPRFKAQYLLLEKDKVLLSIKQECLKFSDKVQADEVQTTSSSSDTEERGTEAPPCSKRLKGLAAVLKHISDEDGASISTRPSLKRLIKK